MSRIPALEKMLQAAPDNPDPDVLYMIAQEHYKAGRHEEAAAWYDRCLKASPAYVYAYYHKALALDEANRRADALETLRIGLAAAKTHNDRKAANEIAGLIDQWT